MRKRKAVVLAAERITIGYARVSTQGQADEGVSLDDQDARIRAYAVATGKKLDEIVLDAGISAKTLSRPGISKVLEGVKSDRVGAIIVCKLDRLTRSIKDLAGLLELCAKKNVALISLNESLDTGSASGRLFINLLGVINQWSREQIAENTSAALAHKRRSLKAYSPTPFGFIRDGDSLVVNDEQQAALTSAKRMRASGATLFEIGHEFSSRGISPRRGKAWYPSSVRAILHSKMANDRGE